MISDAGRIPKRRLDDGGARNEQRIAARAAETAATNIGRGEQAERMQQPFTAVSILCIILPKHSGGMLIWQQRVPS